MKKFKKTIIIIGVIFLSLSLLYGISFKIFTSINFEQKELKNLISTFFKNNFNKAIKLQDVYIDIFGNIVISDLEVSNTSDFNDNISLIKSEDTSVRLDYGTLLTGKYIFTGITFNNSEIVISKKSGKGYLENFKEIFLPFVKSLSNLKGIDYTDLVISLSDANLFYKEFINDTQVIIQFKNISSEIEIYKDSVLYTLEGDIIPYKSPGIKHGNISIDGETLFNNENDSFNTTNTIIIDNFDISYFNSFVSLNRAEPLYFYGGISTELFIQSVKDSLCLTGKIDFNNLNIITEKDSKSSYSIISNENISLTVHADILDNFQRFVFRKIELYDDAINFSGEGLYNSNEYEQYIDISFKTNLIDARLLSTYITPFKNIDYSGMMNVKGRFYYDFKNSKSDNSSLKLNINRFSVVEMQKGNEHSLLNKLDISIDFSKNILTVKCIGAKGRSNLDLLIKSKILRWSPFTSDTIITLDSESMDSGLLFFFINNSINIIYTEAYLDKNIGYEETLFTQTPLGILLKNNNVYCSVRIKKIIFDKNARLSDFKLVTQLQNGDFRIDEFNLNGYDAEYSLRTYCYFSWDYPKVNIKGEVRNFNLGAFTGDLGLQGTMTGNLFIDFDFFSTVFRLSHIIDNSTGRFYCEINSGSINATGFQKKIAKFLKKCGYTIKLDELNISRASILLGQSADYFYINKFNLYTDQVNFWSTGKYRHRTGLQLPLTLKLSDSAQKIEIPLEIKGPLLKPMLTIKQGSKDSKRRGERSEIQLFNL